MSRIFLTTRPLVLAAVLLIVLLGGVAPAAAQNESFVLVRSVPTGAMACLDHYTCNITPHTFNTTPVSYHTLSLYREGYLSYTSSSVYAGPAGSTTSLLVTLASIPSRISGLDLSSDPSDADIFVDNLYYGKTPQVIGGLPAGVHTLVLRKAGYYDYTESFMLSPDQVTTKSPLLTPYPVNSGYGDMRIRSVPAGAAVFVSNNYVGSTFSPSGLYITQLSPGTYPVRITLQDYQPYSVTATVTAGGVYDILANLAPVVPGPTPQIHGQITVRSNPEGAAIFLDNVYRGRSPLTLVDIPVGSHSILLQLSGYQDWRSQVNVAAGSSTDVSGILAPAITPQPTPTTVSTTPLPIQTRSPVSVISILSAIGICGALAIAFRKQK